MNSDGIDLDQDKYGPLVLKICFFSYPDEALTPLLRSYADIVQDPFLRTTLRHAMSTKHITVDNKSIKLLLVDISTEPYVGSYRARNLVGSSAVVFAFSKNQTRFLDSTKDLFRKLKQNIPDFPLYITFIGLLDDSEIVTTPKGQDLAHELGGAYYEMTSADLPTLDAILRSLARKGMKKYIDNYKSTSI